MARPIRFFVKKRGDRRTDSRVVGNIVRTLLFAALFFVGLGFTSYLLTALVIPEWRANRTFLPTTCIVISKHLLSVERSDQTKNYRPEMQILYDVGGESFQARTFDITRSWSPDSQSQQKLLDEYEVGHQYRCWYDPSDPSSAVLRRGYTWSSWLLLCIPLSFVVAGGGGLAITLLNWGTSTERRAAQALRQSPLELLDPAAGLRRDYPTVPVSAALSDSPGATLAYRLPHDVRSLWLIVLLAVLSSLVMGIAMAFAVLAIAGLRQSRVDVFEALFILGWFVAGLVGLLVSWRRLRESSRLGATILEVSDHPVRPGGAYELFLSQTGNITIKKVSVYLLCDERATYRQGTNTRTESCRVVEQLVGAQENVRLARRRPLAIRFPLPIPAHTMHSFRANFNSIEWRLLVRAEVDGRTRMERLFPIVVYPHGGGGG